MTTITEAHKAKLADCIVFKNKKYFIPKLQRQSGPILELTAGQLHNDSNSLVEGLPAVLEADYAMPLVSKFEGFYVVLIGRKAFEAATVSKQPVKCRLISNPTLKNALVF